MKYINKILALIAVCLMVSACGEDFLNLTPVSNSNEEDFYRDESEIKTAIVSVYNTLYTIYDAQGPIYLFGALSSDDAYTDDIGSGSYEEFESLALKANNPDIKNAWVNFYAALYKANKIISKLENSSINNAEMYIGEMKFMRALYYFDMVQMWGGVPLVTKPLAISDCYATGRASSEEVYNLIIEDLKYAIDKLPSKSAQRAVGTPTKGAAYALLGKVYLTKGDKDNASKTLMNIYNKEYSLMGNYADLWSLDHKNCKESIFEIQYKGGSANPCSVYWAAYTPANNLGAVTLQGGGHNQVSADLWNDYETGDPRRDISIQDGWVSKNGVAVDTRFPIKWVDRTTQYVGKREAGDNNFIVLRYADVLLMLAEATNDAKYLNEVRDRVGLLHFGAAGYPEKYKTLPLAIEHERRVELAMEFHRFYDIKRTGRAVEIMKASFENKTGLLDKLTVDKLDWPIPEVVIDQNPDLWKPLQNAAYK